MAQQAEETPYMMRGNRVSPLRLNQIRAVAVVFRHAFRVNKKTARNIPKLLERLGRFFNVDIVDDNEWLPLTDGHADPEKMEFCIPERVYAKACMGDREALSTIFHEIGHLFMAHRVVFHNEKSAAPTMQEDSEYQADTFAKYVLEGMGVVENRQLTLF